MQIQKSKKQVKEQYLLSGCSILAKAVIKHAKKENDESFFNSDWYNFWLQFIELDNKNENIDQEFVKNLFNR